MTPLLFPYTLLTVETAAFAAQFFPHLTVYQPVNGRLPEELQPWVSKGFLKFHVPVPDDEETVVSAAREYQLWARQYQHGKDIKTILPKVAAPRPPFFDESAPAQILTELKGGDADAAANAPRLFNARLFLCLAQQLDQHHRELSRQLNQVEVDAHALIDELKPAEALAPFSEPTMLGAAPEDASDFMLTERLAAWTKLFLADQIDDPLLLTTSLTVFTDFINHGGTARLLLQLNSSEWPESGGSSGCRHQAALIAHIENAAVRSNRVENQPTVNPPNREDSDAGLTIYVIPDIHLRSYLTELAGGSYSDRIHPGAADDRIQNVVVALLNPGRIGKTHSDLPRQE